MSNIYYNPRRQSIPGAKLYFRASGTSNPQDTYEDIDLTTPHSNPVKTDAEGWFPVIYFDPSLPSYRQIHTDGSNEDDEPTLEVLLEPTLDNIPSGNTVSASSRLKSAAPGVIWEETDASANGKKWRLRVNGGVMSLDTGNDAESSWTTAWSIDRTTGILSVPKLSANAGSFTGTFSGFGSVVTGTVYYNVIDDFVKMWTESQIAGTSNATTMVVTGMPAALYPAATTEAGRVRLRDNGANLDGYAYVSSIGEISLVLESGGFTSSGSKGVPRGWSIGYPL